MDADNLTPSSDAQETLALSSPPAGDNAPSAGAMLKAYREEAGMEQETLAAALKVSAQKLQALEADDYAALPALYFARGLASNICRHLEKDPAPVLARMPDEKPRIPAAEKTDTTMRAQPIEPVSIGPSAGSSIFKWILAGAILAALVGGAIFVVPQLRNRIPADAASSAVSGAAAIGPQAATLAPAPTSASATSAPAPATLAPLTLQPAAPAMPAASTVSTASAETANSLQIHATGDSWVRVSNARGKRLFEGTLKAGEQKSLSIAAYPVRVSIAKAENVQITDRGQPFDLASVATQGAARIELKP